MITPEESRAKAIQILGYAPPDDTVRISAWVFNEADRDDLVGLLGGIMGFVDSDSCPLELRIRIKRRIFQYIRKKDAERSLKR